MGAALYPLLADHGDVLPGECVVEIGSERGEGSTAWLADFCHKRAINFYTVDVDPLVHETAVKTVDGYRCCSAHLGPGEEFLPGLKEKIRFAYLDAFDCIPAGFEKEPFIDFYTRRYEELGLRAMTNENSARSHLALTRLVVKRAASRCAILIDDTDLTDGGWLGKGRLAAPFLSRKGFLVEDVGGACLAVSQ